jgi:hypothetical protein
MSNGRAKRPRHIRLVGEAYRDGDIGQRAAGEDHAARVANALLPQIRYTAASRNHGGKLLR